MPKYRCPVCGVVADIDRANRKKALDFRGKSRKDACFPKHPDCELAKGIDSMDFSKLEPV